MARAGRNGIVGVRRQTVRLLDGAGNLCHFLTVESGPGDRTKRRAVPLWRLRAIRP